MIYMLSSSGIRVLKSLVVTEQWIKQQSHVHHLRAAGSCSDHDAAKIEWEYTKAHKDYNYP